MVAQWQACFQTPAVAEPSVQAQVSGRRKLGTLEVSSVGLGVQNMSRKYETTVPYRPEMIPIIRAAYDQRRQVLRHGRGLWAVRVRADSR